MSTWSHGHMVWPVAFVHHKKLLDDSEMATTTLPPPTHFPDILKPNRSIWKQRYFPNLVGGRPYNHRSVLQFKYHFRSA